MKFWILVSILLPYVLGGCITVSAGGDVVVQAVDGETGDVVASAHVLGFYYRNFQPGGEPSALNCHQDGVVRFPPRFEIIPFWNWEFKDYEYHWGIYVLSAEHWMAFSTDAEVDHDTQLAGAAVAPLQRVRMRLVRKGSKDEGRYLNQEYPEFWMKRVIDTALEKPHGWNALSEECRRMLLDELHVLLLWKREHGAPAIQEGDIDEYLAKIALLLKRLHRTAQ